MAKEFSQKVSPQYEILDNAAVAEAYANKLIAASFDGGAVVITMGATRFIPKDNREESKEGKHPPVHVTARLALSPGGAVELTNALNKMLKMLSEIQQTAAAAKANSTKGQD